MSWHFTHLYARQCVGGDGSAGGPNTPRNPISLLSAPLCPYLASEGELKVTGRNLWRRCVAEKSGDVGFVYIRFLLVSSSA